MLYGLNIAAQLCGLMSVVALAFPAFHAARYVELLARLQAAAAAREVAPAAYDTAANALAERRDAWKPWKSWCLRVGTVLAGLACLLELAAAAFAP